MHSSEAEANALMQTSREWASPASTGDVDLIVSYWDDDAVVLPPEQQPLFGKKAIREYVIQSMALPGFLDHLGARKSHDCR